MNNRVQIVVKTGTKNVTGKVKIFFDWLNDLKDRPLVNVAHVVGAVLYFVNDFFHMLHKKRILS